MEEAQRLRNRSFLELLIQAAAITPICIASLFFRINQYKMERLPITATN
jgi:hypothetical protein